MPQSAQPTNVHEAIATALRQGLERLDAQLLLLHALQRPLHDRAWLLAHDTDPLGADALQRFRAAVQARAQGMPLAYLTGEREFHGLPLEVSPAVLIPRPDTETLVAWALAVLDGQQSARVIDLGTGSGAIALALKHARPDLELLAVDASTAALAVARQNGTRLGLEVAWHEGHWLRGQSRGPFDLIVSNPPYIAEADAHLEALRHEPRSALVSGSDGLDDLKDIIQQAPAHLRPGSWLLLEHGFDQAAAVRQLLTETGFSQVQSRHDLPGMERCSGGQWPRP